MGGNAVWAIVKVEQKCPGLILIPHNDGTPGRGESKSAPSIMMWGGGGEINTFSGRQQGRREEEDLGGRVQRDMWRDKGFTVKRGAATDDWGQKCQAASLLPSDWLLGVCVLTSLSIFRSFFTATSLSLDIQRAL